MHSSFDFALSNRATLADFIHRHLPDLLTQLAHRSQALQELQVTFTLEYGEVQTQTICPAAPTLQAPLLRNLVTLQMESLTLSSGVEDIHLLTKPCPASREQLRLFQENSRRDFSAANRALARIRAQYGDQAVIYAQLQQGHLPEAQFSWQPFRHLKPPQPGSDKLASPSRDEHLIRRIRQKPCPLFPPHQHPQDNRWLFHRFDKGAWDKPWHKSLLEKSGLAFEKNAGKEGSTVHSTGPFIISGGWWAHEVHREYYFVQTERGTLAWIYYDKMRRRWFLHGQVE